MASVRYCLVLFSLLAWQLYGMEAKLTRVESVQPASNVVHPHANDVHPHSVHIVYMGGVNAAKTTNNEAFHKGMLHQALGSVEAASGSILYSYTKSFNGFAAVFSDSHAETIRGMNGVASVFKSQMMKVHTTNSWEYLGLNPTEGLWPDSGFGNGTIVGLVDTGITPESESFNDKGFGPIPSKWKGSCVCGGNFTASSCNNKLIGAKYYVKGYEAANGRVTQNRSPRDSDGHGTHTASTSAGNQVRNASLEGLASGTASGGAPGARIAMYKACWDAGCYDADLLAAIEDAIADGVDVLSISIGSSYASDYSTDSIAIGAFHAAEKGVFVACSAGNSGDYGYGTAVNIAPWILTVAASTQNRVLNPRVEVSSPSSESTLVVGGINTMNPFTTNSSYPIVYVPDILFADPSEVEGKIIASDVGDNSYDSYAEALGAVGLVAITGGDQSVLFSIPDLPMANVDKQTGSNILSFLNSYENTSSAIIYKSESVYNATQSPVIAWFSSIGPNIITPDIMKPDISAPGVDILAAWAPTASSDPNQPTSFNIISGTSMACPHAAGTAALVKSLHPDWSPAAIKSAIITTATPFLPLNRSNSYGNDSIAGNSPIATGSGQINPTRAADPGLIFNITTADYISFLCAIGYNSSTVDLVTGGDETCPSDLTTVQDLNYPSIFLSSNLTVGVPQNITRKVTNVGSGAVTYQIVATRTPYILDISIDTDTLSFSDYNEELSFTVSITVKENVTDYVFGFIVWADDAGHEVTVTIGAGPNVSFGAEE